MAALSSVRESETLLHSVPGVEYWRAEREICQRLSRHAGSPPGQAGPCISADEVHAASQSKSFDYRVRCCELQSTYGFACRTQQHSHAPAFKKDLCLPDAGTEYGPMHHLAPNIVSPVCRYVVQSGKPPLPASRMDIFMTQGILCRCSTCCYTN